jgi:hypothetical protein
MDVADEEKRLERCAPRFPFLCDATFSTAFFSAREGSASPMRVARQVSHKAKFRFMSVITFTQRRRGDIFVEPKPKSKPSSVRSGIFPMMSLLTELGNLSRRILQRCHP